MSRFYAGPAESEGPPDPGETLTVTVDATTTLVTGTINGKDWHGRASTVVQGGIVICFYRSGSAHNVNDGALHVIFSDDYGATWTAEDTKIGGGAVSGFPMNPSTLSAGEDAGEPWAMIAPSGDILLFMWRADYFVTKHGTWMARSSDGGESWTASDGPIEWVFSTATADTHDRTYCTDDGFNVGTDIYICGRIYTSLSYSKSAFCLFKSDDDGVTWERVSSIVSSSEAGGVGCFEGGMERVGANTIVTMLRNSNTTNGYQRTSTDLGLTWGSLVNVTATTGILGRQRVYTVDRLQGNVNPHLDNRVLMTGFYKSGSNRINAVWISLDSGATWSAPFDIDTGAVDGGYGDIFWDATNDEYVVVSYKGSIATADLKQYRLTITGLGA